ncbi:hypothetical protein [Streptomyces sp. NPDC126503]|uniref:hypothetical protein n=1 Tax=Streptomyces sp. NPDC126503 TaxID=3155315 RepID=UPI003324B92E
MDAWGVVETGMQLDVGIVWIYRACPARGRFVHATMDSARHDAAAHAVWWHRDRMALTDIALRLISQQEKDVRVSAGWDPASAAGIVPPLEPLYEGELSLVQQRIVCDAVGCPEDSRHRRRQRAEQAAAVPDPAPGPLPAVPR